MSTCLHLKGQAFTITSALASTSTWTMAFRDYRLRESLGSCVWFLRIFPLTKSSSLCILSQYTLIIQREIATGQLIQHLPKRVTEVICFLFRIKRNSHMLIYVNIKLPRSLYLNMQRGSQCHNGNVYRSVITATSKHHEAELNFLSIQLSGYGGYTLKLNRSFNQPRP